MSTAASSFPAVLNVSALPETQTAVHIAAVGGAIQLGPVKFPSFNADGTDVLIAVHASSINPVDFKQAKYNFFSLPLPLVLGWDFSGVVVALGKKAAGGWKVGDEVFGAAAINANGVHAQYVVVSDGLRLARKPGLLPHIVAAGIPIAFTTAFDAIYNGAKPKPGQSILISGAAGGVGHFAVQFAKRFGARVIGLTSKAANVEFLKSIGVAADDIIDYKKEDVVARALELTGGAGVDIVFDSTAGVSDALSAKTLKEGGRFVGVFIAPPAKEHELWKSLESRKVTDVFWADIVKAGTTLVHPHVGPQHLSVWLSHAIDLISQGQLKVHIDRVVTLDQVGAELEKIAAGQSPTGKIVVRHF